MSEPTGAIDPIVECETVILRALDCYFEIRCHELEKSKERAGTELKNFEEARRELIEAEEQLEQIRHRASDLKMEAMTTVAESGEVSEMEEGVSELQKELGELAEAEQSALGRKRDAEERLRRTTGQDDVWEHLAEATSELTAVAMAKVEEIDAFKERLDKRFSEGIASVLQVAS